MYHSSNLNPIYNQNLNHLVQQDVLHLDKKMNLRQKEEYEELLVNRNKEVYIIEGDSRIKRVAIGIDTDGELLVKDDNGNIEKIMAGEVSIRGIYGYV